jgi:hypothetical protein
MRRLPLLALLSIPLYGACADTGGDGAASAPGDDDSGDDGGTQSDPARAIAEADIIQIDGDRLYAMSESGTVSIVDVSTPGRLVLLGQTTLPGVPFEMYRRGDFLMTMSNRALAADGSLTYGPTGSDPDAGALVIALDVRDPTQIRHSATFVVPGEIADSRVVGDVLYLATFENSACFQCGATPRTLVSSFDVANPLDIRPVDQISFQSNAPDSYNLPWGQHWKRSIFVTDERLYIGGHAEIDPGQFGTTDEGIIDVIDITDPDGDMVPGARIVVAGAIISRWQLDERDGVLRVVSQRGAGRTGNGLAYPVVATFRIDSTQHFTPLGSTTLQLPEQEGLRSVRFDDDRAYAITYFQTDPLYVIDLSDPAFPEQRGELYMPGFMFYLEPHGDRLIGLGIDRTDPGGSLNVSLFDVSNPDRPTMLSRVPFATPYIGEDYAILDSEVAEDQDRIHKAFRVLDNGLVVVPFAALATAWEPATCDNQGGGVQLVQWSNDTLIKQALLPLPGRPRRALEHNGEILAISDSNVRAFSAANPTDAKQTAELVIGTCVPDSNSDDLGWENDLEAGDDYRYGEPMACAAGRGAGAGGAATLLLVGLGAALALRRRRDHR